MKKLNLKKAAEEFDMIDSETHLFYNIETGEFDFYSDFMDGVDLYDDTFDKIKNIQNTGNHPFPFYEKLGYKIVGVIPDANGIGKPDILMAKRIKK